MTRSEARALRWRGSAGGYAPIILMMIPTETETDTDTVKRLPVQTKWQTDEVTDIQRREETYRDIKET